LTLQVSAEASPFKVTGKLQPKWKGTSFDKLTASLTGEASMDMDEMNDLVLGGAWIATVVESLSKMVKGTSGMLSDDASRQAGSMARFILQNSSMGVGMEATTQAALGEWKNFKGVNLKFRLTVETNYGPKVSSLKIKLDRISSFNFGGEDEDSMISVLLENTQSVFEWKT